MVLWAYVISPAALGCLIETSSNRTPVGPMLIAAAGCLHLAGALLTNAVQRPTARDLVICRHATAPQEFQSVTSR